MLWVRWKTGAVWGETQPSPAAPHEARVDKCQAGIMEVSLAQQRSFRSPHVDSLLPEAPV